MSSNQIMFATEAFTNHLV